MKRIPLTQEKFAIVDDEDYEELSKHKWFFCGGYARRASKLSLCEKGHSTISMHRDILKVDDIQLEVDHKNFNKLDNRKINIRVCSKAENRRNRKKLSTNTSGYKGVWRNGAGWSAYIFVNGKNRYLGYFSDKHKAAIVWNEAAKKYHGEFAVLNEVS